MFTIRNMAKEKIQDTSLAVLDNIKTREEYDILIKSGTLPQGLNTPEKLMAVIATGREFGMPPMVAINNIHVIAGRTVLSAAIMGALIKKAGMEYEFTEDHLVDQESGRITTTLVIEYASKLRAGVVKSVSHTVSWGQMTQAGYVQKPNWKKMPKEMLRARCMSSAIRANFPEILMGFYFDLDIVDAMDTGHEMKVSEDGMVEIVPMSEDKESTNTEVVDDQSAVEVEIVEGDGLIS